VFIGEIEKAYTILDSRPEETETRIDRHFIMASLFLSNKNLC
jgi:hypothetical protein